MCGAAGSGEGVWWQRWNQVRCLCEHNPKLGIMLDVPAVLPPKEEIVRWHGEPVKALVLSTSVFLVNKRGYPTLSKAHQEMLTTFFQHGVQVGVSALQCFGTSIFGLYFRLLSSQGSQLWACPWL